MRISDIVLNRALSGECDRKEFSLHEYMTYAFVDVIQVRSVVTDYMYDIPKKK